MRDLLCLPIKKDRLGNLSLTDRGDRIRTCDLVLLKDAGSNHETGERLVIAMLEETPVDQHESQYFKELEHIKREKNFLAPPDPPSSSRAPALGFPLDRVKNLNISAKKGKN